MLTRTLIAVIWAACASLTAASAVTAQSRSEPSLVDPTCTYYTAAPTAGSPDWALADPAEPVQQGNLIKADCAFGIAIADAGQTRIAVNSDLDGWNAQFNAREDDRPADISVNLSAGSSETPPMPDNRQANVTIIGSAPRSENPVEAGEGYVHQLRHATQYNIFRITATNGAARDEHLSVGHSAPASYLLTQAHLQETEANAASANGPTTWPELAANVLDDGYPEIARRILDTHLAQEKTAAPLLTTMGIVWGATATAVAVIAALSAIAIARTQRGNGGTRDTSGNRRSQKSFPNRQTPERSRSRPPVTTGDL